MLRLLKIILMLVIVIGASVGGTMFFLSNSGTSIASLTTEAKADEPTEPLATPIFAELEPFTVTIHGEARSRILYVAVTLRLVDIPSRQIVIDYMPEVRDRILKVLAAQSTEQVQTPEGRAALVRQLKSVLEAPFTPQPTGPRVADVLFTAFVVQ
ncbi:flagellar basal body-associated FliL family protein [Alcaligenaceae bacterium CGII-47]|nr:flagellar basal body-associated FliL family protein [Alcaligenaceae bacterium CGII-47]